ncbi:MAG: hypothetical protein GY950_06570 [bacterium]|nr:hypothetical protein [bacterium]
MNYFFRGLLSGNKKFFLLLGLSALWVLALFDLLASIRPPGLFNGKLFIVTAVGTAVGLLYFLINRYVKDTTTLKKTKAVEKHAAEFEPMRESEIYEILEKNPGFNTFCYECKHFNPDLQHCSRNLSDDISKQRIKDVYINNRKYCLYFEAAETAEAAEETTG